MQPGLCLHCLRPEADCKPTACPTLVKENVTPAVIPEIYRELFMPEASDKDVMMWFPAVVAESPHLSFSILSAATNRRSHEQMKAQGRKVLFMATEVWLGQLNDSYGAAISHIQDRAMIEAYDPGHFRDIRRLGLSDFEMKSPVRMSLADVHGRIVVDARCHPTELSRPSVIAASH